MFYFLTQNLIDDSDHAEIEGHTEVSGQFRWVAGHRFTETIPHQTFMLDSDYGKSLPHIFDTTIPVMSQELISVLKTVGVDNFDEYPVSLQFQDGARVETYSAVNFIGALDAINLDESEYEEDSFGDPDFESVVIDPSKASSMKAFRLQAGPGLLVVSEDVADAIKSHNFSGVLVERTENFDDI